MSKVTLHRAANIGLRGMTTISIIAEDGVSVASVSGPRTERCLECFKACLGIEDPAATVPKLVEMLRELLVADLIPDPPEGHVYTLIDADSDEGRAVILRARAVLAKTGQNRE